MSENLLSRVYPRDIQRSRFRLPALADTGGPPPQDPPPPAKPSKSTWMIVGITIAVVVVVVVVAAILLPTLARAREEARRAACQENLKQLSLVCGMYTYENRGKYPVLESPPGRLFFNVDDVYPEYLRDPNILVCPSNPNQPAEADSIDLATVIDHGRSYYYLGYTILNEDQARAFLDVYRQRLNEGGDFETNLDVPKGQGFGGGSVIYRLQDVLDRRMYADPNDLPTDDLLAAADRAGEIPLMFERKAYHTPPGINVLYWDIHIEYLEMESKWPAQQWFLDALAEIDPELTPAER